MYFTIQDENNKTILRGLLKGFGTHTSATESSGKQAFYVHMKKIEILNETKLKEFENLYRLDDRKTFSNPDTNKRNTYVFNQPKLRSKYNYIITDNGYKE